MYLFRNSLILILVKTCNEQNQVLGDLEELQNGRFPTRDIRKNMRLFDVLSPYLRLSASKHGGGLHPQYVYCVQYVTIYLCCLTDKLTAVYII